MDIAPDQAIRSQIVRAGYSRDFDQILLAQQNCAVRALQEMPVLLHNCRATPGESGSALLDYSKDEPEIIGILVAISALETSNIPSLGVSVGSFGPTVLKALGR